MKTIYTLLLTTLLGAAPAYAQAEARPDSVATPSTPLSTATEVVEEPQLPEDDGNKLLPITRSQAEELLSKVFVEVRAKQIEAREQDRVLLEFKKESLKRKLLDKALKDLYMDEYQQRLDKLENMLLLLIANQNGAQVNPYLLQALISSRGGSAAPSTPSLNVYGLPGVVPTAAPAPTAVRPELLYGGLRPYPVTTAIEPPAATAAAESSVESKVEEGSRAEEENAPTAVVPTLDLSKLTTPALQDSDSLQIRSAADLSIAAAPISRANLLATANNRARMQQQQEAAVRAAEQAAAAQVAKQQATPQWIYPAVRYFKRQVFFPVAKVRLTDEALATLDALVEQMMNTPALALRVVGYASTEGRSDANNQLAADRAQMVAEYFAMQGIDPARLSVEVGGEDKFPLSPIKARRVDITPILR